MTAGEVIALSGLCMVGFFQLVAFVRNGKEQKRRDDEHNKKLAERDATLHANLQNIDSAVTDIKKDVSETKDGIGGIREHCAGVTSGFQERLINLEKKH